jgi:hypothetical protein
MNKRLPVYQLREITGVVVMGHLKLLEYVHTPTIFCGEKRCVVCRMSANESFVFYHLRLCTM